MTVKKTVTERVIAANLKNATKSTGPKTDVGKRTVGLNAWKSGLWAKRPEFLNEEEKNEYLNCKGALQNNERRAIQEILYDQVARTLVKLGRAEKEMAAIQNRRTASSEILRQVLEQSNDVVDGTDLITGQEFSAGSLGWDCEGLTLRCSRTKIDGKENAGKGQSSGNQYVHKTDDESAGRWEFEAKLSSPVETILRHEARLNRTLDRAIERLQRPKNKSPK